MIFLFSFIVALIITVVLACIPSLGLVSAALGALWKLPLVFLGSFLGILLIIGLCSILLSFCFSRKKTYETVPKWVRFCFNLLVEFVIQVSWIDLRVEGLEKLPKEPCLFVSNHRSGYDAIVALQMLRKRDIIYISKPENLKVPFYGRYMHRMRFLEIDREDPRKALKTLITAADYMKEKKTDIGIYPEGTRNRIYDPANIRETGLVPFHNGVFKIAKMANAPIVVFTTDGTEKISKNYLRRITHVTLSVDGVIPASQVVSMKTAEIGEQVQNILLARMEQNVKQR